MTTSAPVPSVLDRILAFLEIDRAALPKFIRAIGVIVIVVGVLLGPKVYDMVVNPHHRGQVLFTTQDPASIQACNVANPVGSVKAGTVVHAVYILSHRASAEDAYFNTLVLDVRKDGASVGRYSSDAHRAEFADCLADPTNLAQFYSSPGTYELLVTLDPAGEVLARGTLTITP